MKSWAAVLAAGDDAVEAGAGVAGLAGVAAVVEFEFVAGVVLLAEQAAVASNAALRPQIITLLLM
jgi:hypothetical protein